jgi:hypothetical protein
VVAMLMALGRIISAESDEEVSAESIFGGVI